jgi:hypothetical protein
VAGRSRAVSDPQVMGDIASKQGRSSFFEKKAPKKLLLRCARVFHRPESYQKNQSFFASFCSQKEGLACL